MFWLTECVSGCIVSLVTGALLQTQHVDVFSLVTWNCRRTVLDRMHVHTHTDISADRDADTHKQNYYRDVNMSVYTHTPGPLCGLLLLLEWQRVGMLGKKLEGGICWRKTCWMDRWGCQVEEQNSVLFIMFLISKKIL